MNENISFTFRNVLFFVFLEIVIYLSIYFIHSLVLKSFMVDRALNTVMYQFLWRIISLQLPLELLLIVFATYFSYSRSGVIALIMIFTFCIACVLSFSEINSIFKSMMPFNQWGDIGEGFVIMVSTTSAIFLISKLN